MLSVVIATQESERALVSTLAALVAGTVAGLVREVIIADAGSRDDTHIIADAAGCQLLTPAGGRGARMKAAAAVARGPWLLFLGPGTVLESTWIDETRGFIEEIEQAQGASSHAAVFRAGPASFRRPLVDGIAAWFSPFGSKSSAGQPLLIAKSHYQALGAHRDVENAERELLRRLGRRRIVRLRTRVMCR
jgi:glycosyltransferase involved in cell wall biosynthesis